MQDKATLGVHRETGQTPVVTERAVRPIEILLVEDNPDDVELTLEALAESKVQNKPHVARDGVEALRFLRKEHPYQWTPMPDVILLDLNMPRMNGREVLRFVKEDPELRTIPVVVLTTSKQEEDILRSYRLQAAAYVTKPVDFDAFVEVVRSIDSFWLQAVTYTPRPPGSVPSGIVEMDE